MRPDEATIRVDGRVPELPQRRYLALNKPRGLVTTAADEQGRETVYRCFEGSRELLGAGLLVPGLLVPGWIAPVGRLDKASEGLLLFSNDPAWAARITDPGTGPDKTYHVQVDAVPSPAVLARLVDGVEVEGAWLRAVSARLLRAGDKRAWLEVVLDEGRNRQIRRLLAACDLEVLRLVRTAIGPLLLGDLGKGQWRDLSAAEVAALGG